MNYLMDCGHCNRTGCKDGDTFEGTLCPHCEGKGRVVIVRVPERWDGDIRLSSFEVENYRQRGYVVEGWQ